jgi:hypothetical protein
VSDRVGCRRVRQICLRLPAVNPAIKPLFEAEARERQGHGQTAPGKTLKANLPEASQSRDQAASAVNVSPRSVESAAKELRKLAEFPRRPRARGRTLRLTLQTQSDTLRSVVRAREDTGGLTCVQAARNVGL